MKAILVRIVNAMDTLVSRAYELCVKMISRKGLVFLVATMLRMNDYLDDTSWAIAASIVIGTASWEKSHTKVKESYNERQGTK